MEDANGMTMSEAPWVPPFPVGRGVTDYEKYMRTVELLSLQKPIEAMASPEELLFQITHQASELWMKQMLHELERAVAFIREENIWQACRSFRLVHGIQDILIRQVDLIAQSLSIVEYGKIRTSLGQGSGQESPGFNFLLAFTPKIGEAFFALLDKRGVTVRNIYEHWENHLDLHTLAECLMDYDDAFHKWRTHHFDMVFRTIGAESNSLKGVSIKVLQRGVLERFFPQLLEIRNILTNESGLAYGGQPLDSAK